MFRAIKAARRQSKNGPRFDPGMCLRETRLAMGIGAGAPDAIGAWRRAKRRHPEKDPANFPRGVPVFWSGGSEGHGHVAIATGHNGMCWTVDKLRPGFWDRVPIDSITREWRLNLLGWTEDLNGRPVPDIERTDP